MYLRLYYVMQLAWWLALVVAILFSWCVVAHPVVMPPQWLRTSTGQHNLTMRPIHEGWFTAATIGISGCNSVKFGGPTPFSQHTPRQFHNGNRTETLVWSRHEGLITPTTFGIAGYIDVENGRPTSISQHNPQRSHGWNLMKMLVWLQHDGMLPL